MDAQPEAATEKAAGAGQTYRFLSSVFRQPPARDWFERLKSPEISTALGLLAETFGRRENPAALLDDFEHLRRDYAELFEIPAGRFVAACESRYVEIPDDAAPPSVRMLEVYHACGFVFDAGTPVAPDHLSAQLEFLGHLAAAEEEALLNRDDCRASIVRLTALDLIDYHLLDWVPRFISALRAVHGHPFYVTMAELTGDHIRRERMRLVAAIEGGTRSVH
ncbi:MAG TPA: molecular chaperone TorD family protein [Thermoanaerobaculia bacterium]|nr:molecular chaperone TorD family protein [Thermoanaerobaculia bacterium]